MLYISPRLLEYKEGNRGDISYSEAHNFIEEYLNNINTQREVVKTEFLSRGKEVQLCYHLYTYTYNL